MRSLKKKNHKTNSGYKLNKVGLEYFIVYSETKY